MVIFHLRMIRLPGTTILIILQQQCVTTLLSFPVICENTFQSARLRHRATVLQALNMFQ